MEENVINMIENNVDVYRNWTWESFVRFGKRINKDVKIDTTNSQSDIEGLKNMIDLKGKNIIVTGASGGIGNSIIKK